MLNAPMKLMILFDLDASVEQIRVIEINTDGDFVQNDAASESMMLGMRS